MIELTPREFALLHSSSEAPERVFSKSDLLDAVWDSGLSGADNVVEVYVGYICAKGRRALRRADGGDRPRHGYRLVADAPPELVARGERQVDDEPAPAVIGDVRMDAPSVSRDRVGDNGEAEAGSAPVTDRAPRRAGRTAERPSRASVPGPVRRHLSTVRTALSPVFSHTDAHRGRRGEGRRPADWHHAVEQPGVAEHARRREFRLTGVCPVAPGRR